ncbi:hypothetical protein AHAS_Ahas19G0232500 [Arachis hypogaea]
MADPSRESFNAIVRGLDIQTLAQLIAQINVIQASASKIHVNPNMDPSSEFYLHPTESPGTLLIASLLDHHNYDSWCNTFVLFWLNVSLNAEIAQSVMWISVASNLWRDLKKRFYQGDKYRIIELDEEPFSMKQGDLSVTFYFMKLMAVWE